MQTARCVPLTKFYTDWKKGHFSHWIAVAAAVVGIRKATKKRGRTSARACESAFASLPTLRGGCTGYMDHRRITRSSYAAASGDCRAVRDGCLPRTSRIRARSGLRHDRCGTAVARAGKLITALREIVCGVYISFEFVVLFDSGASEEQPMLR